MKALLSLASAVALALGGAAAGAAEPPDTESVSAAEVLDSSTAKVTLDLQDVPLDDALRILSKQFGLSIITAKDVTTSVTARFNEVSLKEALHSLVTINGFSYRTKGSVIEVYTSPPGKGPAVERPTIETFELKYASAEKTKALLRPFLSEKVGKIEADTNRNILIVYDVPDNMACVAKVVERIDRPEPQVTISAEIIEASIDVDETLGIDWETRLAASGAARPITFPFSKGKSHSDFVPSNNPGDGDDDEFSVDDSFPYPSTDDFTFGTLDASGLKAVLQALKTDGGTNLIGNPEITTLNNREAKINLGTTVPVPTYTTNLETGVSTVTGFEDVETGTILRVTPRVNDGGKSVTLKVAPEISEIIGYKGQYDERPVIVSRKAETTVRLRDGETLVIGGLVSEKTVDSTTKIPLLGDIPLLGWLFKSKHSVIEKSSLYIFITPRIMNAECYRKRAKCAVGRLKEAGFENIHSGADDIRKPGASPFQ